MVVLSRMRMAIARHLFPASAYRKAAPEIGTNVGGDSGVGHDKLGGGHRALRRLGLQHARGRQGERHRRADADGARQRQRAAMQLDQGLGQGAGRGRCPDACGERRSRPGRRAPARSGTGRPVCRCLLSRTTSDRLPSGLDLPLDRHRACRVGVNLIAFERRLTRIGASLRSSPRIKGGGSGRSSWSRRSLHGRSGRPAAFARISPADRGGTVPSSRLTWPASILEASSMSSMMASRCRAD